MTAMRKPVRGWAGCGWEDWGSVMIFGAGRILDVGERTCHWVPAVALSLAPEDVEARRQAFEGCVEDFDPQDGIEVLIEAVERAWGLSPEDDDDQG